jgi:hypothetical protein
MFQKIEELKQIRNEKKGIKEKEKALSSSFLTDLSFIPQLHRWYEEISFKYGHPNIIESTYERKKFLFIVLFLYSPNTFIGEKMKSGLRHRLKDVLKLRSGSVVSHDCDGILFLYERYKDFRNETDEAYRKIAERLKLLNPDLF